MRLKISSSVCVCNRSAMLAAILVFVSLSGCNLTWLSYKIASMMPEESSLATQGWCTLESNIHKSSNLLQRVVRFVVPKGATIAKAHKGHAFVTGEWQVEFEEGVTSRDVAAKSIQTRLGIICAKKDQTLYVAPTGIRNTGGVRCRCQMEIGVPDYIQVIEEDEGLGFWVEPPEGPLSEHQRQMGYDQLDWRRLPHFEVINLRVSKPVPASSD